EHGYEGEIFRINVISICQTEYSYNILQDDKDKGISAIMPCRIGVYETTGGEVYLTRMNIGLFSKMFKGKVGEILRTVAEDDEKIIRDIRE
ncbi:MAG: DUF302 domain-containing protein, partial [Candidatus Cloacimonetes bacterium]|nr:DUF302 domain-containing protein [Candidatus Cloacimonadota bacterium]